MKIFLIRHTETEWNEQFRYIGRTDLSLSDLGRRHAEMMAQWLGGEKLEAIYASGLARAEETAAAIARGRGLSVKSDSGLRELDFGQWEGLTHDEIQQRYPVELDSWLRDPASTLLPDGEDWPGFEKRVRRSFAGISESHDQGSIAIVSHGGPIKSLVGEALGIPAAGYWQIYLDKGAISCLFRDERGYRVSLLNDTCYLHAHS